jgi:alkyl hydroperoxide reductase subunit AhpF
MIKKLAEHSSKRVTALALAGILLAGAGGIVAADTPPQFRGDQYDVVVVGAGPGGVAASVQAARMGAHVALLEETDWIGGQMTAAGVGTMDEGNMVARTHGIYKEFARRATAYYQAPVTTVAITFAWTLSLAKLFCATCSKSSRPTSMFLPTPMSPGYLNKATP